MFNLSLFRSTSTFACKEFKKRFGFWQILNLKIVGMVFVLSAAYVVAALLAAGLINLIVLPQPGTVHFEGFLDLWHWIVQYCVSISTGLRMALSTVLLMAIIAGFFACLYFMFSFLFISLANTLDVAHDKKPRDFKLIKQVVPLALIALLSACFGSFDTLLAPPVGKIMCFSLLSLFFNLRFYFAFFIVLDKSQSAFQALCKSWKLTKGKMTVLFPVVLFVFLPNIAAWAISHKHIQISWILAFVLWLIWWIVNAFFMLVMARAYVVLNRA